MEIRQIPNYPDYGATKDGRIYSYITNKFLKRRVNRGRYMVILFYDNLPFTKIVSRLVFETFHGYAPECVTHIDGNGFNSRLENLKGMTKAELNKKTHIGRKHPNRKNIIRVNIATREIEIQEISYKTKDYIRIHNALSGHQITSGGYLYFYEGEKERLVKEISARIKSNTIYLNYTDNHDPFRNYVRCQTKRNKMYLEILEGV
ncbi:HNH endonuclease [Lactococcus muris]|uniref:HNH endonuclease n=1 Tax=Lactococcus muris TaxID=2941330 RepID=UPI00230015B9